MAKRREVTGDKGRLWGCGRGSCSVSCPLRRTWKSRQQQGLQHGPQWGVIQRADGPTEPSGLDVKVPCVGASLQETGEPMPSASAFSLGSNGTSLQRSGRRQSPPLPHTRGTGMPLTLIGILDENREKDRTRRPEIHKGDNLTHLGTTLYCEWTKCFHCKGCG